jgi:hypothetical protein
VWRRIPPWHFPKKAGQLRPDSPAFDDDSPEEPMSVIVARDGRDPTSCLVGHDGFGLVALTIEDLTVCEQQLIARPLPDEPDHALVVGVKTEGKRRDLSKRAVWIVPPPAISGTA